jgi:hypothetical protein
VLRSTCGATVRPSLSLPSKIAALRLGTTTRKECRSTVCCVRAGWEFITSELPAIMHVRYFGESMHAGACCRTTLELGTKPSGSRFQGCCTCCRYYSSTCTQKFSPGSVAVGGSRACLSMVSKSLCPSAIETKFEALRAILINMPMPRFSRATDFAILAIHVVNQRLRHSHEPVIWSLFAAALATDAPGLHVNGLDCRVPP